MEAWEKAFREYIAPQFTANTLNCLRTAILRDDDRLTQGIACESVEHDMSADKQAYYVCPISYMAMCEYGLQCNGDVQDAFADVIRRACFVPDRPFPSYYFLSFVDQGDMRKVKAELLRVLDDILLNYHLEVSKHG